MKKHQVLFYGKEESFPKFEDFSCHYCSHMIGKLEEVTLVECRKSFNVYMEKVLDITGVCEDCTKHINESSDFRAEGPKNNEELQKVLVEFSILVMMES